MDIEDKIGDKKRGQWQREREPFWQINRAAERDRGQRREVWQPARIAAETGDEPPADSRDKQSGHGDFFKSGSRSSHGKCDPSIACRTLSHRRDARTISTMRAVVGLNKKHDCHSERSEEYH